jgi:hypothetical protein
MACQRRTGSAFAVVAHFKDENLEISGDALSSYEYRSDESHRCVRLEFCPRCGTTVTLTSEQSPGGRTVSGGTFDELREALHESRMRDRGYSGRGQDGEDAV